MISYPLNPHLSSELWQHFKKFEVFKEEIEGGNNQKREIYDLTLPDLSFLKNLYMNINLIKTKIFVSFYFFVFVCYLNLLDKEQIQRCIFFDKRTI